MLDFSWGEIIVIGAVALVVIGPKDLPEVLRTVGRWTSAARNMAREFQGHVDDMIRESGVDEIRNNIKEGVAGSLEDMANTVDPDRTLRDAANPDQYSPDAQPAEPAPAALNPPPEPAQNVADAGEGSPPPAAEPPVATPDPLADAVPKPVAV